MTETLDTNATAEERRARLRSRLEELNTVLVEKYGATPEDLAEVREQVLESMEIIANAPMPSPFSNKEPMSIIHAPIV